MNHQHSKQHFAATRRGVASNGAIEWEELPSLVSNVVGRRMPRAAGAADAADSDFPYATIGTASPWDDTRPVGLDDLPPHPPSVFREALEGLATREVTEPDVFRHFFGTPAQR